jgi:hypothetical protein
VRNLVEQAEEFAPMHSSELAGYLIFGVTYSANICIWSTSPSTELEVK